MNPDYVTVTQPGVKNNFDVISAGIDGAITIRNLQDTIEDTTFAGQLSVDAFRSKFVHATSERSIEKCHRATAKDHQGQPPVFYERLYVAEYHGRRAGILGLAFHGDPKPNTEADNWNEFGCCDTIGLICFNCAIGTMSDVPQRHCYVDHICVDESFRGKGIGKALLDLADMEARRMNCTDIYLWVKSTNRAKNLYERHGYQTTEVTPCCLGCCLKCMTGISRFTKMNKHL